MPRGNPKQTIMLRLNPELMAEARALTGPRGFTADRLPLDVVDQDNRGNLGAIAGGLWPVVHHAIWAGSQV